MEIWPKLWKFGQNYGNLAKIMEIWSKLWKFGHNWENLAEIGESGQNWENFCKKLVKLDHN